MLDLSRQEVTPLVMGAQLGMDHSHLSAGMRTAHCHVWQFSGARKRDLQRNLRLARRFISVLAWLQLAVGLCACESAAVPGQEISAAEIASQYRLGPGDHIRITVFNQTNLSSDYTVDGGGYISLPLLGPLLAQDQTVRQLEQSIAQQLIDRRFLVSPSVAIQMIDFRPYYILGEINSPGSYPYIVNLTITKAVAAAKGYTYRANKHRAYIQRAGEKVERLYELTPGTAVLPGDTIRIPERRF